MKRKGFSLISGNINGFSWNIVIKINENETWGTHGTIIVAESRKYQKDYMREYRDDTEHQEKDRKCSREYNEKNKKIIKIRAQEYRKNNRNKIRLRKLKYYQNHTDEINEKRRTNYKSDPTVVKRYIVKHKKSLGFVPLNQPSSIDTIAHHIDNIYVIYVPENVHQQLSGYDRETHRKLMREWLKINRSDLYALCLLKPATQLDPNSEELPSINTS